jgi:hypothetical protein
MSYHIAKFTAKNRILNSEVNALLSGNVITYSKYASQLINMANQNAQGTRQKVVAQLSDLIQAFTGKH